MMKKFSKGFTIIELLVVVAIIAVLAAIVLVNVTGYINKGKNAAIQGNLATVLTNGAVYYDTNGNYGSSGAGAANTTGTNFCTSSGAGFAATPAGPAAAINSASGGTSVCSIGSTYAAWCACSALKDAGGVTGAYFCVDSTGTKKTYTGQASGYCSTACPVAAACI